MTEFEKLFRFLKKHPGENILAWESADGVVEELTVVIKPIEIPKEI